MNEEQEKPAKKKWYKNWSNILLLAIIVIVICGIVALAGIMSIGGGTGTSPQAAYATVKEQLTSAVEVYQANNSGALPTLNGTVTINGSVYQIIDVCSLLTSQGGLLRNVPDGIWSSNGSTDDNCDSGCEGCRNTSHYIWAVNSNGNLHSTCVGNDCKANGQDGYQGIWP